MGRFSIIQENMKECYVCGSTENIHIHHIFQGNANRKISEKHHCIVALCARHHNMSDEGVHFNKTLDLKLKRLAQMYMITHGMTIDEWIKEFGKSWL